MESTTSNTYTLHASFISKSGHKSPKTLAYNLTLEEALDKKTDLLERVPHCVSASITPEK